MKNGKYGFLHPYTFDSLMELVLHYSSTDSLGDPARALKYPIYEALA